MPPFFIIYKYILGIGIIITLAIIGYATFPFSQKQTQKPIPAVQQPIDTSLWQTYRNEELGFEIKIPPEWEKEYLIETKGHPKARGYEKSVAFSKKIERENFYTKEKIPDTYVILVFALVTKEWWEDMLTWPTGRSILIFDVGDKKYIYGMGQDNTIQDYKEIEEILKTFTLIK